ncbi:MULTISPECIES: response regulator transcription factor [Sporomusa]|uniref:response regulator n=1 Tax=Sporomusa TaxID=2375 RepID=UPI00166DF189|nr:MULTISPECIES: response regulator transcription factor [Sporomusa]HML35645.1 response regulator transcription factor [Sporomusa sphaeroides]
MNEITVAIVDDHTLMRSGLNLMLAKQSDIRVVGEAANAEEALLLIEATKPDVVLLDISMPGTSGLECIQSIVQCSSQSKVILLTMHEDSQYVQDGMAAGAMGYVLKKAADEMLYQAIRNVAAGVVFLQPDTMKALLWKQRQPSPVPVRQPYKALSEKETTVLALIAQGFSNAEIASELKISVKTVETYKYRIMEKLDVRKRSELVKFAMQNNIVRT